ncbi:inositol monophosphatase family protein [Mycobacterium shigaense]|uniref:Inositol-1-monophosphatase n=1 Tax=Mycobacterium shigaense TaxID=722731 RepID=A0A1Z4EG90_9MYCO|nr:inositol monophosphatase family protein [Mycobacterium shigaense]MEA1123833.1 inositol monophosphatase family protein [Mycobacterium shigaense]PRI16686.1 inositol monophosphatase [Mycobacterium shigaense]BAX91981.1 inositol-1-monophosphatase SuhB [Mycobacterium shigaense]
MTQPDDRPAGLRSVAETLAAEAAEFVRRRRAEVFGISSVRAGGHQARDGDVVRSKSTPTDPVTVVDTETERLLRDRLAELRPGEPILGEEGGGPADPSATSADAVTWVLDPVDGTVNFVYGIPAYAVSIGAQRNGESVAGAVADVVGGRVYSAALGLGAHVTDAHGRHALRCSDVEDLSMALLGTGFGYSTGRRARQAELLARLLPAVRDVRRIGSAALDLCMVAAGRLDAYYEHGLQLWDRAAGGLIAAEAGARVVVPAPDESGSGRSAAGLVVAAAPGVADQLLAALAEFDGLDPILD